MRRRARCGERPSRRRRVWEALRRFLGRGGPLLPPFDPPDEAPALVPTGPPRRPRPSSAVALELPREPEDVDARGRWVDDGDDRGELGLAPAP